MLKRCIGLLLIVCFITGCGGVRSSLRATENEPTYIYSVSEAEGKEIMYKALSDAFPGYTFPEIGGSTVGYYATKVFALDRHTIKVQMVPVEGVGLDGKVVTGYAFEVTDSGTMPITVGSKTKKIYKQILADAADTSSPIRATNVKQKFAKE